MKSIVSILMILLSIASSVYAWNDEETHPTLSEFAAEKYFSADINFGAEFMDTIVQGQKVRQWIMDGSKLEDTGNLWQFVAGTARSLNHFHNASKATLAEARLTDVPSFMPIGGSPTWESTPLWAQDGDNQKTKVNGDWSWQAVRNHYYKSLTTSDSALHELWQADYLKGLGYQMHLIQDMGQPNHVRNDTHIWDGASLVIGLETWARKHNFEIVKNQILTNMTIPTVTVDLTAPFGADTTKAPVANLFDTRGYRGTRPPSAAFNQGLAEYTNSNFFSEHTIFASEYDTSDKHYQPYPRKDETNVQDYIKNQMALTTVTDDYFGPIDTFVVKKLTTSGEPLNCLVTSSPDSRKVLLELGEGTFFYASFMYDLCFREYAEKLIPVSAAYSRAMLEYFHRGKMTITPATNGISFRTIKLTAQNSTLNETMGAGEVRLVIRYKAFPEAPKGGSLYQVDYPPEGTSTADYAYKVSAPQAVDLTTPQQLTFDFSADTLPYNFADMTMQLVFKGKLGSEEGAVAVSPLMPIDGIYSDIDLSLPASGVYAKASDSSDTATFNELRVTARTDIPGGLSGGAFKLALEYRRAKSDPFQSAAVDTAPENGTAYLIKLDEKNGVSILPAGQSKELVFDLATAPLPVWATDVHLNVVYVDPATLASRAVGYHDVSEPTPVDIFNNTDHVCLNNQWYPAGDPATIALADQLGNRNGFDDDTDTFRHNLENIYYRLAAPGDTASASAGDYTLFEAGPIAPATFKRLGFILSDYELQYSSMRDWVHIEQGDGWSGGTGMLASSERGTGMRNQMNADGAYVYQSMFRMRGKPMWGGAGTVYGNGKLPAGATCDWALLPTLQ